MINLNETTVIRVFSRWTNIAELTSTRVRKPVMKPGH